MKNTTRPRNAFLESELANTGMQMNPDPPYISLSNLQSIWNMLIFLNEVFIFLLILFYLKSLKCFKMPYSDIAFRNINLFWSLQSFHFLKNFEDITEKV